MFPLTDTQKIPKSPLITLFLILLNIYVFVQELSSPNLDLFIVKYSLIPANIDFSNLNSLSPFVTSLFLHAGFLHILSNMWFLWIFGHNVEAKIGHIKYLFFYLFAGVAASIAQYLFISSSYLPMMGASGAIAGILGAYLKFFPNNKIESIVLVFGLPLILAIPANFILIYWFITQAFNGVATIISATASVGGIAYLAHTGGFLAGLLTATYFTWPNKK